MIYGALWELTKPISTESNCDGYSLFLFPDQDKVDTQVGKGTLVKLRAINAGNFGDSYEVFLNGPKWTIIKPELFSLKPEEAKSLFLYVSPGLGTEGKYDIEINVRSKCVNESQITEVAVLKE